MTHMLRSSRIQLLIILVLLCSLPTIAYASLLCRSDPRVDLSNGVRLNIGVSIAARVQDITRVSYEVHVPRGVSMTNTIHTPGWATNIETFTLVADQAADQYSVSTVVRTRLGNAQVVAYSIVKNDGKTSYQTSGMEGQALTSSFGG
jgi:hypothetical protein